MPLVKRVRPKIGDVIEVQTPSGLSYAHYTHNHVDPPRYGALLRVIEGLFTTRPTDFSEIVTRPYQFTTFFPLAAACSKGIVTIVANEIIPATSQPFPTFRSSVRTPNGRGPWWLWNGKTEQRIGELKPGMESLPVSGVLNDTLLIERIVQGWRHEHDT
jgi:hypothetical protein